MKIDFNNSVWALLRDLAKKQGITEIIINGCKSIFVERAGQFIQLNVELKKDDITEFIKNAAYLNNVDTKRPVYIVDGNLPDGSRVNIICGPYTGGVPAITIRKYLKTIKSFDENPNVFNLDDKWISFFKALVNSKMNVIVSGGTGVGKTTFLNLLLNELPKSERVITIEDTLELNINVPNCVRLEAFGTKGRNEGLGVRDLVKNTLRMRPDRIIIGEVRGGELFDLLQAMNTGHEGSMTSLHSNSPKECLARMETLFLLAGYDVPFHVVRRQISSSVDFIIQVSRNKDGQRIISQISEITGMEGDNILMQNIAVYEDRLISSGIGPKNLMRINEKTNFPLDFFK